MNSFLLYLILQLDNIFVFFKVIIILCFLSSTISLIIYACEDFNEKVKHCGKFSKKTLKIGIIFFIITMFIPSTQNCIIAYIIPKIINNQQIQNIPNKILKLGEKYLDEKLQGIEKNIIKNKKRLDKD